MSLVTETRYQIGKSATGTEYSAESLRDQARVSFPDVETNVDKPIVFLNDECPIDLEDVMRLLPLLEAVVNDPRVQARWEARQAHIAQQAARRENRPNMKRVLRFPVPFASE